MDFISCAVIKCCFPYINKKEHHSRTGKERVLDDRTDRTFSPPPPRINISRACVASPGIGLLGRLPAEIRIIIYEDVLADQPVLHLTCARSGYRQIRHFRCWCPRPPHYMSGFCSCYSRSMDNLLESLFDPEPSDIPEDCWPTRREFKCYSDANLALLRTCRWIYNEGIDILYNKNVFSLNSPPILLCLAESVLPPQHLLAMKHLRIEWEYRYDRDYFPFNPSQNRGTWEQFWIIVAQRMRLDSLYLKLTVSNHLDMARFRETHVCTGKANSVWLKPMLQVKGIRDVWVKVYDVRRDPSRFTVGDCRILEDALVKSMSAPLVAG